MSSSLSKFLVTIAVFSLMAGCGSDDKKKSAAVVEPPPELVIPEPLEPLPTPRVVFYTGIDQTDPLAPVDFLYSFRIDSRSVLRQSSGLSATIQSEAVPLGGERQSEGYLVLYENERLFLGRADSDRLTQISNFRGEICNDDRYRIYNDGVGFVNSYVVAQQAGGDTLCDTADDEYVEIRFTATPQDEPVTVPALRFWGTPVQDVNFDLTGWLLEEGGEIVAYNSEDIEVGRLGSLTDSTVLSPLRYEGLLVWLADRALYVTTAEELASGSFPTAVATLNQNRLDSTNTLFAESSLIVADGSQLKSIELTDGTTNVLSTFAGFAFEGRLQQGTQYYYVQGDDRRLYRILKTGSAPQALNTAGRELFGQWMAFGNLVYFATEETNQVNARVMNESSAEAPRCAGEDGVMTSENGCYTDAHWLVFRRLLDSGVTYLPIRFNGKETTRVERNGPGDDDDQIITDPPFKVVNGEVFLNAVDMVVHFASTGQPQIQLGTLPGYSQWLGTGTVEVSHGLVLVRSESNDVVSLPDTYYFDTKASRSLQVTERTRTVTESLIRETVN